MQSQHSIQGGQAYGLTIYSRKIQVVPAAVVVISVCCDVLWWLVQFVCSYEWQKGCPYPLRLATDYIHNFEC